MNDAASQRRLYRRRRLVVGLGLLVAVAAVGAGLYVQQRVRDSHVRDYLAQAKAAGDAGRLGDAAELLERYLNRFPDDASILSNYAEVRVAVELPRGDHLLRAIDARQRLAGFEPGNRENRLALLRLYDHVQYSSEAIELADAMGLDDPEVVLIKANQQARTRRFAESDLTLDTLLDLEPLHLSGHELRLRLMRDRNLPDDAFRRYAADLEERYPDEPNAWTIAALAYALVGDAPAAHGLADRAAEQLGEDPKRFSILVNVYDAIGRYEQATDLAEQALGEPALAAMASSSVRRLWEARRYRVIADRMAEAAMTQRPEGVDHLVWLSRFYADPAAQNAETLGLDTLPETRRGQLWAELLPVVTQRTPATPEQARTFVEALEEFPADPHLHYYVGELLLRQGAVERAVQALGRAAQLSPNWSAPYAQLAQALWLTGRPQLALDPAHAALRRDPVNPHVLEVFLTVAASNLDRYGDEQIDQLAAALDQIDPDRQVLSLAPLDVAIASRSGASAGREALRRWLPQLGEAPAPVLWGLLRASQRGALDRELAIVEARAAAGGIDASVASLWAAAVASDTSADEGWAVFEREAQNQSGLGWDLARAQLAERLGRDDAATHFAAMLDGHEQTPAAARAVLQSDRAWEDAALIDRARAALSASSGDDDYAVRWAGIRQQLDAAETARARSEALSELGKLIQAYPYLLDPQVQMAAAQADAQNWTLAAQYLETALRLAPYRWDLGLRAVAMLDRAGQRDVAVARLRQAEADGLSGIEQAASHARQWLAWGDLNRARALLADIPPAADPHSSLGRMQTLVAALSGDAEQVESGVSAMIETGELGPALAAVNILTRLGQAERLEAVHAQAADHGLSAAEAALVRGVIDGALGRSEAADDAFREAMEDPALASPAWRQWLTQAVASPDAERLSQAVMAARAEALEDPLLGWLSDQRGRWSRFWEPAVRVALAEAVAGVTDVEALGAALAHYVDGREETVPWSDVSVRIRQTVATHERSAALRQMLIRAATAAGDFRLAADFADEAAATIPQDLQIRELQLGLNTQLRRWDRVAQIGQAMAELSPRAKVLGLLASSEASVQLDDGDAALNALERLERETRLDADTSLRLRTARLRARLIRGDDPARVAALDGLADLPLEQQLGVFQTLTLTRADAEHHRRWAQYLEARIDAWPTPAPDAAAAAVDPDARLRLALAAWWRVVHERTTDAADAAPAERLLAGLRGRPTVARAALLMQGQLMEVLGRDADAAEAYEALLADVPDQAVAMNNLAMVRSRLGDGDGAVELAESLVRRTPGVALFQDTHAAALRSAGRPDEAAAAAQRAVDLDPAQAYYRLTLGLALHDAGRTEDAAQALTDAEALMPAKPVPALTEQLEALRNALQTTPTPEPAPRAAVGDAT